LETSQDDQEELAVCTYQMNSTSWGFLWVPPLVDSERLTDPGCINNSKLLLSQKGAKKIQAQPEHIID
jgi:hypothetical protein